MPGVPDYRDTPTPTPHRIPRALETGKLDPGWLPAGGGGSVTSAQFQGEVAARIAADDALSNAISALALDDLVDVSAPAPADGDALMWNSAQAQWVASAMAGGGGSVTSADFVSLRSDVGRISVALSGAISAIAANSAQMTSADNANSAAAAAVSVRLDSTNTVVSNQGSAIVANSAQMTSADNAISAAAAAVSVRLNSTNTVVSNQGSAIVANSAQMTSADNAISAAVAAVSAAHTSLASDVGRISLSVSAAISAISALASNHASLVSDVGRISVSLSGAISAIAANSAQMTSADNAISAAAAAVSVRLNSTNTVVSNQGSAIVANSAQMTSADNAISAAVNVVSNALSNEISVRTSAVNAVSNRLSTWTLDNLAGVSVPSPTDQQVLVFNSAAGQWLASTLAAGTGSVTSSELSHVASIASAAASNVASLASDVGRISVAVAAGLVSTGPIRIVLAGDQIVSATAPVSLSGFTFNTSTSAIYSFEVGVLCNQPLSTQGLKLVLSIPAGEMMAQVINPAALDANRVTILIATGTAAYVTISNTAGNRYVRATGCFRQAVGTTFRVKVGTNLTASTATSVITVKAGSYGFVWRMGTA